MFLPRTATQVRRFQARDWADKVACRQTIRARDANGGHWLGGFSGRQWKEKMAAYDYRCHWCGTKLPARELTVDHLYPLSLPGRRNDIASVVPACLTCNSMRGNKTPAEFTAYLIQKKEPVPSMLTTRVAAINAEIQEHLLALHAALTADANDAAMLDAHVTRLELAIERLEQAITWEKTKRRLQREQGVA